jgi:hypothetical protein
MFLKFLVLAALAVMPLAALAQGHTQLGPATNNSNAASSDSGAVLQPNSEGQLQPADAAAGGMGLSSGRQALQTAGTQADLNSYLSGELESGPQTEPSDTGDESNLYFWSLLLITTIGGLWLWLEGRLAHS